MDVPFHQATTARRLIPALAALHGLSGVAFAAVAAHLAGGETVMTGAVMQLVHAPAAIVAARLSPARTDMLAALAFVVGALLFAGGVYASALAGVSLGPAAPAGGLLLMLGWLLLAAAALHRDDGG